MGDANPKLEEPAESVAAADVSQEKRGPDGKWVSDDSRHANEASALAGRTGSRTANLRAMRLHNKAETNHRQQAATANAAHDAEGAGRHTMLADDHMTKGSAHARNVAELSAAAAETDDVREVVQDAHAHLMTRPGGRPSVREVQRHIKDTHGLELSVGEVEKHMPVQSPTERADEASKNAKTEAEHAEAANLHQQAASVVSSPRVAETHKEQARYHIQQKTALAQARWEARGGNVEGRAADAEDYVYCSSAGISLGDDSWSVDRTARWQWMPGGVHTISATYADKTIELTVRCDSQTATAVQASLDQWRRDYPKLRPFVDVEHREEEAAAWPEKFDWATSPEPGVFCSAMPGQLGVRNVNGKIHRSFSPTFRTNAEYNKARMVGDKWAERMVFPEGAIGSRSNPATVTGINFAIGSLTNVPAFTNILPVKAKQADPLPVKPNNADKQTNNEHMKLKVTFVNARGSFAAGQVTEVPVADACEAIAAGDAKLYVDTAPIEAKNTELKQIVEARKTENLAVLDQAVVQARSRGAIAPKDEAVRAKAAGWLDKGMPIADVIGIINDMPGKVSAALGGRLTQSTDKGLEFSRIDSVAASLQEVSDEYVRAREPMGKLIAAGETGIKAALKISTETSAMLKTHFLPIYAKGGDFMLRDVIRAAGTDVADPDGNVGTLATGLILMRNLGYLKNKLSFLPYISTDLRNEPAMWNQTIRTRYITPPGILTYVPGIGYTSDAATIAAYNAANGATQTAGTLTPSVAKTTDVDVKINKHYGVEITFPTSTLGSTMRNLFAEQQGAQFYSLAEQATKDFLSSLFTSNWTGIKNTLSLGANFGLSAVAGSPGVVGIKNSMTLSKLPDVGRFALLHSIYHDQILNDSNLVTAKAITAVVNKDLSAMESGELPILYGVKVLESQLSASKAGVLVSLTDGGTIGNVADTIGFAGNSASMLFVARVPQDYTTVFKDIPATASIEIITEPDSGLSIMFVKHVNHGLAQVYARCALMYGFAQGDPRQGILLKP